MNDFFCQTFTEVVNKLGRVFEESAWKSCLITTAYFRIDDTWLPLFTRIRFDRGAPKCVREPVLFGRLELREEQSNPDETLKILTSEKFDDLSLYPHLFQDQKPWHVLVPDGTWHDWYSEATPVYIMKRIGSEVPDEPFNNLFVRIAQEINTAIIEGEGPMHFATTINAVDWWLKRRVSIAQHGTFSAPVIEVILPLMPGHVKSLSEVDGALAVELEPFTIPIKMEAYLAFHDSDANKYISDRVAVTDHCAQFKWFPIGVYSIEVRASGKLISFFRGEANYIPRSTGNNSDQERLLHLLFWGERESCEFKDLGDKRNNLPNWDMLKLEIPKTAGAMANTSGGSILVGVCDDGYASGINDFKDAFKNKFKCDESEIFDKLEHFLQKHILYHIKNPPRCSFQWVRSEVGTMVLMILVTKNQRGDISELKPGHIYVRRGASDCMATGDEIKILHTKSGH